MARVTLDGVRKIYHEGTEQVAVDRVDVDVKDGEFVVLVGPSGCGKSTTLRMIAGLESISAGTVKIGDRVVNDVPPKARDIAMVFQNYALYPHMTVRENLGFALKLRNMPARGNREAGAGRCCYARASGIISTANRASCQVVSVSASHSAARSSDSHRYFCSTSRCPILTLR